MNDQDAEPAVTSSNPFLSKSEASPSTQPPAMLRLRPATRQTVVKTITTTTIEYAPIPIPRPPSPQLSGDYRIDQKKYPLELALRGRGHAVDQKTVDLPLGTFGDRQTKALYTVPRHSVLASSNPTVCQTDRKGKRKAVDEIQVVDATGKLMKQENAVEMADISASTRSDHEGPRRKVRKAQISPNKASASKDLSQEATSAVLPSPVLSPCVSEDEMDPEDSNNMSFLSSAQFAHPGAPAETPSQIDTEVVLHEERIVERDDPVEEDQKHLSLTDGYELATLMSLGSIVNEFKALPDKMQVHVLYNLLRHSSIPVVQVVNEMIQPALKRDFIADLPSELATQILTYLDSRSIAACLAVSKTWKRFIDAEGKIWTSLLRADNLWIGDVDKTDEKDSEMLSIVGTRNKNGKERTLREMLALQDRKTFMFLKRYTEGIWDQSWDPKIAGRPTSVKLAEVKNKKPPRKLRRSSTRLPATRTHDKSTSASISSLTESHFIHPMKMLYKRRKLVKRGWHKDAAPRTIRFPGLHSSVVTCLQFDNRKLVSASDDPAIDIFDTKTGALKRRLEGHEGGVWALQYIGNILVSGSTDRTLRIWNTDTGNCSHIFYGHTSTVRCLQIVEPVNGTFNAEVRQWIINVESIVNPDPQGYPVWEPPYPVIVTGSRDFTLRIWRLPAPGNSAYEPPYSPPSPSGDNPDASNNPYHLRLLKGHTQAVRALAAHGRICVSGSYDFTLRVWDILSGACKHRLIGHTARVYSVVYDHEREQAASACMDGTVRLWSTKSGEPLFRLDGHSALVGLLGSSYHYLVSAGADSTLKIWNPANGDCIGTLSAQAGAITCFKHDDFRVVSGSEGQLRVWDIRDGKALKDISDGMSGVWQVNFSDRYVIAAVQRDGHTEYEVCDYFSEFDSPDDEADIDEIDSPFLPRLEYGPIRTPKQEQCYATPVRRPTSHVRVPTTNSQSATTSGPSCVVKEEPDPDTDDSGDLSDDQIIFKAGVPPRTENAGPSTV